MLKSEDGQAVFVGTSNGVYRVPVQHCLDYPTRQACLGALDPYCGWNSTHCSHLQFGKYVATDVEDYFNTRPMLNSQFKTHPPSTH